MSVYFSLDWAMAPWKLSEMILIEYFVLNKT